MVVIRCTKKLLDRIKPPCIAPVETTGSNRLGDWYATLLIVRRTWLIVAVSEKTLLPVVIPAVPFKAMAPRLCAAAGDHLRRLGIPSELVDEEMVAMREVVIAKTASRRVLGSLNDFCGMADARLWSSPETTGWEMADRLAEAPCGPLGMGSPGRVTEALFRGR